MFGRNGSASPVAALARGRGGPLLVEDRRLRRPDREPRLGFGRMVVSETEAPNIVVNLV